jgi:hypothetical protein
VRGAPAIYRTEKSCAVTENLSATDGTQKEIATLLSPSELARYEGAE